MQTPIGRILVVDDDVLNRIKLSTNLEDAGYAVALAKNGADALAMMRAQTFDTVLLDLMMPVMDGFEVLEEVKLDGALQHLPIIVISAEDDLESVVRCIENGATDHLPKPFNPVMLRARVRACVEKKLSHDRELKLFAELEERYQQLQELQKLRDDLTHMIVHDLRTPLTSLLTGIKTIPLIRELDPVQDECLNLATQGGEKLLSMINELLDISKMEDGSLRLEFQKVEPATLMERAVAQAAYLAEDKNLRLQIDVLAPLPAINADEDKLIRVLVNLCGNAIKFTPAHGSVTIAAKPADHIESGGVVFSVADTGEGIPAECFDRIFEKFGQVETRQSGRTMSTGLGLAFCKMVVELHGGTIWVESRVGEGSKFSFCIST